MTIPELQPKAEHVFSHFKENTQFSINFFLTKKTWIDPKHGELVQLGTHFWDSSNSNLYFYLNAKRQSNRSSSRSRSRTTHTTLFPAAFQNKCKRNKTSSLNKVTLLLEA